MDKKYLKRILNLMENGDKIIFHINNERYKIIEKRPDFDWISPCTGEFFIELKKLGE